MKCNNKDIPCLLLGAGNFNLDNIGVLQSTCATCESKRDTIDNMLECARITDLRRRAPCGSNCIYKDYSLDCSQFSNNRDCTTGTYVCEWQADTSTCTNINPICSNQETSPITIDLERRCDDLNISTADCKLDGICYENGLIDYTDNITTIDDLNDYPALKVFWNLRCNLEAGCEDKGPGDFCRQDEHLPIEQRNLCMYPNNDSSQPLTCMGMDWSQLGGGKGYIMSETHENSRCDICSEDETEKSWCINSETRVDRPYGVMDTDFTVVQSFFKGMNTGFYNEAQIDCSHISEGIYDKGFFRNLGNNNYRLNERETCAPLQDSDIECKWDGSKCIEEYNGDDENIQEFIDINNSLNNNVNNSCVDIKKDENGELQLNNLDDKYRCVKKRCSAAECCNLREPSGILLGWIAGISFLCLSPYLFTDDFRWYKLLIIAVYPFLVVSYARYTKVRYDWTLTLLVFFIFFPLLFPRIEKFIFQKKQESYRVNPSKRVEELQKAAKRESRRLIEEPADQLAQVRFAWI